MILCDLPYGTTACKWDVIIPFTPLWDQYERIIKDNGAIVLTASQPFTSALVMSNPKLFKCEWIWHKNTISGFATAKFHPLKNHESVLVFGRKAVKYNPIKENRQLSIKSKKRLSYAFNGSDKGINEINGITKVKRSIEVGSLSYPKTVQRFNNLPTNERIHPTQKPVALFEYLIKTYTNEGDTVLDNCAGSGTTAIACMNTGRNYILMEKEEKYYNIIQDRIKKHAPQLKIAI